MKKAILLLTFIILKAATCYSQQSSEKIKQTEYSQTQKTDMENKDFTSTILVDQAPSVAFNAIMNFRAWWSEEIEGKTDQLNETFFYHYKDVHLCKIKLIEIVTDKKLVYQVVENEFNFVKDKTEWVGTKLIFELMSEGTKTKIVFTHEGLVPEYECYNVCHDAWTSYIQGSLQSLITTGKGKPNAKEGGLNEELVNKWGLPNKTSKTDSMKQKTNFTISIEVDKSPAEVFNAVSNVRGWWSGEIEGDSRKLNDEFSYRVADVHYSKQKVTEMVPNQRLVWLVTESSLNFISDKSEWTGTQLVFDITRQGNKTKLTFTHQGLVPEIECYSACSNAWSQLIQQSLMSLITTGKGVKIF